LAFKQSPRGTITVLVTEEVLSRITSQAFRDACVPSLVQLKLSRCLFARTRIQSPAARAGKKIFREDDCGEQPSC